MSMCCEVDDVNQSNEDGLTVLHNGICSGSHEVLEFLVHAGCDVNVADCDGWLVSHIIQWYGHPYCGMFGGVQADFTLIGLPCCL